MHKFGTLLRYLLRCSLAVVSKYNSTRFSQMPCTVTQAYALKRGIIVV